MISRRDPPEVLQATEHALDGVAIAIQERREAVLPFAIGLRRDVEQPEQARKAEGMPSLAAAKSAIGRSSSRRTASPSARQTTSTRRESQLAHRAKHFTGLGPRVLASRHNPPKSMGPTETPPETPFSGSIRPLLIGCRRCSITSGGGHPFDFPHARAAMSV